MNTDQSPEGTLRVYVSMKDGNRRLIAQGKTEAEAHAIVHTGVMHLGADEAYFIISSNAPNGSYDAFHVPMPLTAPE